MKESFETNIEPQQPHQQESDWDKLTDKTEEEKQEQYQKVGKTANEIVSEETETKTVPNVDTHASNEQVGELDEETKEIFLNIMDQYRSKNPKETNNKSGMAPDENTNGIKARDAFLYDQRVFETELNSRLTKVEELEAMSNIEGSGVKKDVIDYIYPDTGKNCQITVYTLQDYPYEMLTSSQGSYMNRDEEDGNKIKARFLHPELWMKTKQESMAEAGQQWGQKGLYTDTISSSYSDSSEHSETFLNGDLVYGFDHVLPNSVKNTSERDAEVQGRTPDSFDIPKQLNGETWSNAEDGSALHPKSENRIEIKHVDDFPTNDQIHGNKMMFDIQQYNEIAHSRYDETGNPIKPDFIRLTNNYDKAENIDDIVKKHAAFFNIPIVRTNIKSNSHQPIDEDRILIDYTIKRKKEEKEKIDTLISEKVGTMEQELHILSETSPENWKKHDSLNNKELYKLTQEQATIKMLPTNEAEKANKIQELKQDLDTLFKDIVSKVEKDYKSSTKTDPEILTREISIFEQTLHNLASKPIEKWDKHDEKWIKSNLLDDEEGKLRKLAKDIQIIEGAPPINEKDKETQINNIEDRKEQYILDRTSRLGQRLRSLAATPSEKWSDEAKRSEQSLLAYLIPFEQEQKILREQIEQYKKKYGINLNLQNLDTSE